VVHHACAKRTPGEPQQAASTEQGVELLVL
jgi:hypothetical protein